MFESSFPKEYLKDVIEVEDFIRKNSGSDRVDISCATDCYSCSLNGAPIEIPYRFYADDVDELMLENLSDIQKSILYCIYTRNTNGYVRQKYVDKLLQRDLPSFAIPFVVKLCDEYVIEILECIYGHLRTRDNSDIYRFCNENRDVIRRSYSRMTSYWNEYYRRSRGRYPFNDYIGRKLFMSCLGYNRSFER